jgi:hypothetical protein
MKKLIFLILFSSCLSQIKAQDTLKAMQKNFSTELNINPLQGSLNFNNALQQIKVRSFLRNDLALRFAFNLNSKKNDTELTNPYGISPVNIQSHKKSSTFGLSAGVEKHFKGTKRLSPYLGGEIGLSSKSSDHKIINGTTETTIDGAWLINNSTFPVTSYDERAYFRYGINLLTGFDFYIAKNFYFGYEFTFQFNFTKYKDIDVTTKNPNNPQPANTDNNYDDKDSFIGPSLANGIRLGFVF